MTAARAVVPSLIVPTPPLPIKGSVELDMPVERLWQIFEDVRGWSHWNPCIWRSWMVGGKLELGATLVLIFNPIESWLLYKLPATARIVELEPRGHVTWEVDLPGFHALHTYSFAALGPARSAFGSSEVAEGRLYFGIRRFWLAHFRYVCERSLAGASDLVRSGQPRR
jgi:polyketide cyclase/dehydrase/lipid transport protein